MTDLFWLAISAFSGIPVKQLKCKHPQYSRDFKVNLLPEENAMDFYEICLNCGKQYHEKTKKGKRNGR